MANLQQLQQESWLDIPGYEGLYQISSLGNVRSLDHYVYRAICKGNILIKGRILKFTYSIDGYRQVTLYKDGKRETFCIHRNLYFIFNPHAGKKKGYEVDHIDNNKVNNSVSNLQYIKTRSNSAKRSMNLKKSSLFTGVSLSAAKGKWQVHIRVKGKSKYLGRYVDEIDASIAYQNAFKELEITGLGFATPSKT